MKTIDKKLASKTFIAQITVASLQTAKQGKQPQPAWMGLLRSLSHYQDSHQQQTRPSTAPCPALHTQHILITLVKVFQMYYENSVQELFYFCYLQSSTEHCVTADHYFRFPWLLALTLFCSQFYLDYFCSSLLPDTVTFSLASTQNKAAVPQHMQTVLNTITCLLTSHGQTS